MITDEKLDELEPIEQNSGAAAWMVYAIVFYGIVGLIVWML